MPGYLLFASYIYCRLVDSLTSSDESVGILATPTTVKTLLIVLACLFGVIVAFVTGLLTKLGGKPLPTAILAGGAAFGGTVGLLVVIYGFLQ